MIDACRYPACIANSRSNYRARSFIRIAHRNAEFAAPTFSFDRIALSRHLCQIRFHSSRAQRRGREAMRDDSKEDSLHDSFPPLHALTRVIFVSVLAGVRSRARAS
jgi:hypothetical protein